MNDDALPDEVAELLAASEREYRGWGATVRLLLYIGAALEDATPAQRTRLRKRMGPMIEHLRETGDIAPFYRVIHEVHGMGWRPKGEAAEMLKSMEE